MKGRKLNLIIIRLYSYKALQYQVCLINKYPFYVTRPQNQQKLFWTRMSSHFGQKSYNGKKGKKENFTINTTFCHKNKNIEATSLGQIICPWIIFFLKTKENYCITNNFSLCHLWGKKIATAFFPGLSPLKSKAKNFR